MYELEVSGFEKDGGYHELNGIPRIQLVDWDSTYKYASASQSIIDFINSYKPLKGHFYVRIINVASGEWWGGNNNADYFPENQLNVESPNYGYLTFKLYAKVYRHHANKDPKNSFGTIPFVTFNAQMHYVETIIELGMDKNADIYYNLEKGIFPNTSMGTKVPYDVCSICGRKASTQKERCPHILFNKNKIYEDGKQALMINYYPRFFDQSIVMIPADNIAVGLERVLPKGNETIKLSALDAGGNMEKVASDKSADFEKQVEGDIVGLVPRLSEGLDHIDDRMSEVKKEFGTDAYEAMEGLSEKEVLAALDVMSIVPTEDERRNISLYSGSDAPDHSGTTVPYNFVNKMASYLDERSFAPYYATRRLVKIAEEETFEKSVALGALAGTGAVAASRLLKSIGGKMPTALLSVLTGLGVAMLAEKAGDLGKYVAEGQVNKEAGLRTLAGLGAATWFGSNYYDVKRQAGLPVGTFGNFVADHPMMTGFGAVMAANAVRQHVEKGHVDLGAIGNMLPKGTTVKKILGKVKHASLSQNDTLKNLKLELNEQEVAKCASLFYHSVSTLIK